MVCQAASQMRFWALKHENGIDDRTTVIVRVIACFQTLQNCQAEYFRQLLKPVTFYEVIYLLNPVQAYYSGFSFGGMVTAEEPSMFQQSAAPNLLNLDPMAAFVQPEHNCSLPYFPPALISYAAFPRQPNSHFHGLNAEQLNAIGGFVKSQPPNPTLKPLPTYSQCIMPHKHGVSDIRVDVPEKRFLIFDQCRNHTRLFFSLSCSPQNQIHISKTLQLDQQLLVKPVVEEKWGENSLTDEEEEMLEDSEEIDALFYSDTDYSYDKDSNVDEDNDDVTSRTCVPFSNEKSLEELSEEVPHSHGMQKRQKLLDGRYGMPPSLLNSKCLVERASSCTYEDDAESSCPGDKNSSDGINSTERGKKVKIRDALKTLEAILPGLNSNNNDPLLIIEKAIVFLKSMRIEAEALGLGYLNGQSTTSP